MKFILLRRFLHSASPSAKPRSAAPVPNVCTSGCVAGQMQNGASTSSGRFQGTGSISPSTTLLRPLGRRRLRRRSRRRQRLQVRPRRQPDCQLGTAAASSTGFSRHRRHRRRSHRQSLRPHANRKFTGTNRDGTLHSTFNVHPRGNSSRWPRRRRRRQPLQGRRLTGNHQVHRHRRKPRRTGHKGLDHRPDHRTFDQRPLCRRRGIIRR